MAERDPEKDAVVEPSTENDASHAITSLQDKELDRCPSSAASSAHSSISTASSVNSQEADSEVVVDGPTLSRTSSAERRPVKVPRLKRRGLLGQITILAEVEDATTYSRKAKWFITFIVAEAAVAAPLGSAILLPALQQIITEFDTSDTVANLSVALYMLSMSIFPLWWSSFSELLGRRTIYLTSFALFTVFSIVSAESTSIAMLTVLRMLGGGASASVQAVGAGTIADVWEPKERGRAMGIFYLGPLCGPLFAPLIGGLLAERWDWRSTQWFLTIYGVITFVFVLFALPETLKQKKVPEETQGQVIVGGEPQLCRVSTRETIQERTEKWLSVAKYALVDPLKTILYLRYPPVFLTVIYASITFGALYALNISLEQSFGDPPYNFSTIILGLLYIPASLGYILASVFGGRWMDYTMAREAKKAGRYDEKGKLKYQPEDRMRENAWVGSIIYPAGLIWYGWTVEKGTHWIVPLIACFFFGFGSMLIFSMATTMLTEFMPKRSSSGVAVNNFVRNIFSCIAAIVASPAINDIGNGWLFTILGLIAFVSSSVIWAMRLFGPRWRVTMEAKLS